MQVAWHFAIPALLLAACLGVACAVVAVAYSHCIAQGAAIDVGTLARAVRRACSQPGWQAVPPGLAVLSAGALVLAALAFLQQPGGLTALRCAACAVLLTLALIDARCGLLPDALTLPLLWAGLLLAWAGMGVGLHDAVLAVALGYLFLRGLNAVFQACRGRAGIGGGDIKLLAALGAWLGWAPLPGLLLAACLGGIAFAALAAGSKGWRASLAFGPFLAMAGAYGLVGGPVVQFLF